MIETQGSRIGIGIEQWLNPKYVGLMRRTGSALRVPI
jgi:hypothetical protein